MSMFALTNARGETVDINNDKLLSYTPTGLGVQFTNTYSQYETYFKATKSTVTQGQFQIYILFGDVESQAYQTFSDFAQFLAYQPLTLTYTTDSGVWYRDGRLNSLTKTEIGGSTVFATDRINESFTLEFINNWYNNKSAEYKSYDPDPNLGTYGKIYGNPFNPLYRNRNFVLNSSGLSATSTTQPTLNGAVSSNARSTLSYGTDGITMTNASGNTGSEWYYQIAQSWQDITKTPLSDGNYTISVDVMGTASQAILRYGQKSSQSSDLFQAFTINNTAWTRISMPIVFAPNTTTFYIRINGGANGAISGTGIFTGTETIKFRNVKIEYGTTQTSWQPAPEDSPVATPAYTYAYAPYYVYMESTTTAGEKMLPLVNDSKYFGVQQGSPCIVTITGATTNPHWTVLQDGVTVSTDGFTLTLADNQRLIVSSYPEDQYARVYNPDGSFADVSQLQDFTMTNFVQIPEGESTVLVYVDKDTGVNLTFKEERLLV